MEKEEIVEIVKATVLEQNAQAEETLSVKVIAYLKENLSPLQESVVDYMKNDMRYLQQILYEINQMKFLGIPLGLIFVNRATQKIKKENAEENVDPATQLARDYVEYQKNKKGEDDGKNKG